MSPFFVIFLDMAVTAEEVVVDTAEEVAVDMDVAVVEVAMAPVILIDSALVVGVVMEVQMAHQSLIALGKI